MKKKKGSSKKGSNIKEDTLYGVLSGKHICLIYNNQEDLIDLVVPYFNEGLQNNELCMWVISKPLTIKEAKEILSEKIRNFKKYMEKDQLQIINYKNIYLSSGKFNQETTLKCWAEKEKEALQRGFYGLRVCGDTSWVKKDIWEDWIDYEMKIEKQISKLKMTALCTYPFKNVDVTDVTILAEKHRFAFYSKDRKWHIIKNVKLSNLLFNVKYFLKE